MTPTNPITEARAALERIDQETTALGVLPRFQDLVTIRTALSELLTRLREVEAERDALKAAKWDVKHTDTMNDMVAMGLARDCAEQKLSTSQALLEECREALKPFAEFVDCLDDELPDDEEYNCERGLEGYHSLTCGNYRRAASLIEKLEGIG